MDIIPTTRTTFEEIVNDFIKDIKVSGLNDLAKILEMLDQSLYEGKQSHLRVVKFKERVIQTTIGMLRFKRRYYYDTYERKYLYLLDAYISIPIRNRYTDAVKLKLIEAASEMSYEKAGRYGCEENLPASKSTVCRLLHDACFYIEDTNKIIPNPGKIHLQIDEKFINVKGKKNKNKLYTGTIFQGVEECGKKRKLLNKTLISGKTQIIFFKKINSILKNKYKVKEDEVIYVSGDLATYIQNSPEKILICKAKYVPDKYHIVHSISQEIGVIPNKNDLNDKKFIEMALNQLKENDTVDARKLVKLIISNPNCFETYLDPYYEGCSQEGMNSHYYASRFAKVPNVWNENTIPKLSEVIEARANKQNVKIGFHSSYYEMPYDLEKDEIPLSKIEKSVINTDGMPYAMRQFFYRLKNGYDVKLF